MKEPGSNSRQTGTESGAFGPSFGYLVAAVLVAGGVAYWLTAPSQEEAVALDPAAAAWIATHHPATESTHVASAPVKGVAQSASLPTRPLVRVRGADEDPSPDLTDYLNPGEKPTMNEVIDRLRRAGVTTGVAAFNPPGTKPVLVGLAVPEDFALPPGYVRHHQTTDDGQAVEPILMYAPDHPRFVDASRQPIGSARDRVVPPEQAPPGLPLRRVVVPAPVEPDKAGS
ncbi:hypothetical protein [Piscinibacter sp. HJYY11]|uniref:hypothetical protein n=1 Tax=Piscinibacter sp. HJYY11 TaxID=2801333 RepID=UPI00191E6A95|nr:hypothetical protein [Piscinibacter sp. HJYY11]MBL0730902.1 hypothetical protein [Piscinibacter sp. HJYY11]